MASLQLNVLSLAYSSWSMRAWLALTHAKVEFVTNTVELAEMGRQGDDHSGALSELSTQTLKQRQALGSVSGLYPVLDVDGSKIHESLAICEFVAERYAPTLWPKAELARAQARAVSCEMLGGFTSLRAELSCHLFGRVPNYQPSRNTINNLLRIYAMWEDCLNRWGGPFLFGEFSIADAMYFPVLSRLQTYDITLPESVAPYAAAMQQQPAVQKLMVVAAQAPRIPIYDEYLRGLGGDPRPS